MNEQVEAGTSEIKKFNLAKFFAWSIAFLYIAVNGGMLFYLVDSPNRLASNSKIEYLEILAQRSKTKVLQSEINRKINDAKKDRKFTNREFEAILDFYKSKS